MQEFNYKISCSDGLHARPAGMLIKCAKSCSSDISISLNGKTADAKKLFSVMSLCVKQNDVINIKIEGNTEKEDYEKIKQFCKENI